MNIYKATDDGVFPGEIWLNNDFEEYEILWVDNETDDVKIRFIESRVERLTTTKRVLEGDVYE